MASIVDQQDKFYQEVQQFAENNTSKHNHLYTRDKLNDLISKVKNAKEASKKSDQDRHLLKKYDIIQVADIEKLIKKGGNDDTILYYLSIEDMYDIIKTAHVGVGHGGLHKTNKELKKHFANISREAIRIFTTNCEQCILKRKRSDISKLVVKPIISADFNCRGQVDLVDLQSVPDQEFKWIMHYQDHLTKFSVLRALKSKRAAEVAYQLLDIFLLFGAPHILQSDNGREFTAHIITELKSLWSELVIVHGRPRHPQSQGAVERANADIKEMLISWMNDNDTRQWSEGLRFVQFQKNRSYHRVIDQSPYHALFGSDPKIGLSSSSLPKELLPNLETEEDLVKVFKEVSEENSEIEIDGTDENTDAESVESERELNDSGSTRTTIEVVSEEVETPIIRARKRTLSGQQIQADVLTRNTKQKLSELSVGDNVIIPIPQYDRAPTDQRNIQGVVVEVGHFGYRVGTIAGNLSGVLSRNQLESISDSSLSVTQIPDLQLSLREAVKKNSKTGGQGYLSCKCKGGCNNSKCKCKKQNVLCNSRCHGSLTCSNK
ncbi:KRAB-A domain-containing protein 2-like [Mytilus trossulus]|uniref:KRAB-A domain-containing protein 2-like n=1 Tax=Mytilus trossulus TaxID=6551 RepID=UPI00300475B6